MTKQIRPAIFLGSVLIAMVATILAVFLLAGTPAKANPVSFAPSAATSLATTSVVYLAAGTATSTLVYDSYGICGTNEASTGSTFAANSASLLTQFAGSSTSAVLNISLEYSQNCVDWYRDATLGSPIGTTSQTVTLNSPTTYSWKFDNLPVGGVAGTNATTSRIMTIATPVRAVRVVYSITGANGAIWGQIVPKKDNQ